MDLPSDIKFAQLANGVRFDLPPRQNGILRFVGLVPMGFGCLFGGFAIVWTIMASGILEGPINWIRLLFGLWGVPFIIVGVTIIFSGLKILFPGQTTIELRQDELRITETSGLIRRTKRRSTAHLSEITVEQARISSNSKRGSIEAITAGGNSAINLHFSDGKPLKFAAGYDSTLLIPLAHTLAEQLNVPTPADTLRVETAAKPAVSVTQVVHEALAESPSPITQTHQPASSRIQLVESPDALVFMLPRLGFLSRAAFLLFFAIFWLGISCTVTGGFAIGLIIKQEWAMIFPVLFGSVFILIGIAILVGYVHLATATAVLVASPTGITFTQQSRIRKSEWQLNRPDITDFRVGPSGTEINNKPVLELQISTNDKHKGLLGGRDESELHWLATRLRTFYQLNQTPLPPAA